MHSTENGPYTLHLGDCLAVLKTLEDNSVDSIVTDPPAGISFMGKHWDSDRGGSKQWINWMSEVMKEALRVAKPGAHAFVWALPRTSHWTATACEWAGWEIRDVVVHIFGSGFPKSLNVSLAIDKAAGAKREVVGPGRWNHVKGDNALQADCLIRPGGKHSETAPATPATPAARQWAGYGTALKPAAENWLLLRKPLIGTVAENVLKWGTGALNIDASRIGTTEKLMVKAHARGESVMVYPDKPGAGSDKIFKEVPEFQQNAAGRFPSHLVLDEEAARLLDEQSGERKGFSGGGTKGAGYRTEYVNGTQKGKTLPAQYYADTGGASRFFYVAKPSRHERDFGLEESEPDTTDDGRAKPIDNPYLRGKTLRRNTHPTVKPYRLMRYLTTMITPPNGVVLDCFMGSGTTGAVAVACGFRFIGIEKDAESFAAAQARIASVRLNSEPE